MSLLRSSWSIRTVAFLLAALLCAGYPGFAGFGTLGVAHAADGTTIAVMGVHGHRDISARELEDLTDDLVAAIDDAGGFDGIGPGDYGRSVWDQRATITQAVFLGSAESGLQEGRVLYDNAQFQGALVSLEKAEGALERGIEFLREPKLLVEIHLYEGLANMALGDIEAADTHFEEVARTDPARALDPVRTPPKMLEAFEAAKTRVADSGIATMEITSGGADGADVYLNGLRSGRTPTVLDVPPGRYHITVHHPEAGWDYQDEMVYEGDDVLLDFDLERRGIRPLGQEKQESSRSRKVQSLYRTLSAAVDADLLLMASIDDGDNLHLQLYSPRSEVFSSEVHGLVTPGGAKDKSAFTELVDEVLRFEDGVGGIRPDDTSTKIVPIYIGRNPTLNLLLTGAQPDERVVVQAGGDGGTTAGTKPVHKQPLFWILIGTAIAGGAVAGIAGGVYANQEPVLGNGTVTVTIEP